MSPAPRVQALFCRNKAGSEGESKGRDQLSSECYAYYILFSLYYFAIILILNYKMRDSYGPRIGAGFRTDIPLNACMLTCLLHVICCK
jgi:hypothetical protein